MFALAKYGQQTKARPSGVSYFEAGKRQDGTTPHPFAGTVGSPVTSDANWGAPDFGTMSYAGEYATLALSGGLIGFCKAVHFGTPEGFTVNSANVENDYDVHFFGGVGTSDSSGSPVVRNDMAYFVFDTATNEVILSTWRGGVGTSHVVYSTANGMDSIDIKCVVNGDETISYTGTVKALGSMPEDSVSGTTTGTVDTSKLFTAIQMGWADSGTKTDFIRIEGEGFPY